MTIYRVEVLVKLESDDRAVTSDDATEVLKVAMQTLINDGYEDQEVVVTDFSVEEAEDTESAPRSAYGKARA